MKKDVKSNRADTRTRILAAGAAEFAARGFAGAGVDRIARQARVNKAMIYYHFKSKAGLYREILRATLAATGERVRAIAASGRSPQEKLEAFVDALAMQAAGHPHFPPIMLRELAERGRHLDPQTLRAISTMPNMLRAIIDEGRAAGAFRDVHPMLAYHTVVGPLMFYFSSAPVRARIAGLGIADVAGPDVPTMIRHVQAVVLSALKSSKQ